MDDADKREARAQFLRIRFRATSASPDLVGLRKYVSDLGSAGRTGAVTINSMSFEGGQSTGQITDDDVIELQAAMQVLAELDPDNTPSGRPNYALARFGCNPAL